MLATTLVLAVTSLSAAIPPTTFAVAMQPAVGLSAEEAAQAQQKISDELVALGAAVTPGPQVEPACIADSACVEGVRAAIADPPAALLVLEFVRIGPVLQLTAAGAAGAKQVHVSESLEEARMTSGPVLPEVVRGWATEVVRTALPPPSSSSSASSMGGIHTAALVTGALGTLALIGGAAILASTEPVLQDRTSTGQQKQDAAALGWGGVASLGLGVVGVTSAVGLFFVSE